MYVVTVTFLVKPTHLDSFLVAMKKQAQDSLTLEPNCSYFDVCQSAKNPAEIFLYEIYNAEADFQAHLASTHFKQFSETVADWVENKTVNIFFKQ